MQGTTDTAGFLGCGWKFPPEADPVTGRIKMSRGEEDIREAVKVILFTGIDERMMQPSFGCGIREYAFTSAGRSDISGMEQEIEEALIRFEPRIIRPEVTVSRERLGSGILEISVAYVVRATNNPYNLVFPYYINEGM